MKYFGSWSCREDVARDFGCCVDQLGKVHFAWYGGGDYCGSAFVLFECDGQLYEAHGSHCSCHGLEGQFDPEETSVEALAHVVNNGYMISDGYDYAEEARNALRRVIKRLK